MDQINDMDDADDVLIPRMQQVKVFLNKANNVVLLRELDEFERQTASSSDTEVHIIIPKHYVPALIERLKHLLVEAN